MVFLSKRLSLFVIELSVNHTTFKVITEYAFPHFTCSLEEKRVKFPQGWLQFLSFPPVGAIMAGPEKLEGLSHQTQNLPLPKAMPPRQDISKVTSGAHHNIDPVQLSPENTEYQQFLKRIDQAPDIRTDRLKKIRQALEAGSYHIDSEVVADRLIRESLITSA